MQHFLRKIFAIVFTALLVTFIIFGLFLSFRIRRQVDSFCDDVASKATDSLPNTDNYLHYTGNDKTLSFKYPDSFLLEESVFGIFSRISLNSVGKDMQFDIYQASLPPKTDINQFVASNSFLRNQLTLAKTPKTVYINNHKFNCGENSEEATTQLYLLTVVNNKIFYFTWKPGLSAQKNTLDIKQVLTSIKYSD